jgi:hypothetical protein
MKKLLVLILFLLPAASDAALLCTPIEWGGTGTDYAVGTTTSGTWYVWNCSVNGILISQGRIIVKGHKPSLTCLSAIINPFVFVDEKCNAVDPEQIVRYNRLLKSLETAKGNLPK